MPRVSVVIPCYNQGQYLDQAVDSVLAQTFDDYEIIVVDDGSTDQTTVTLLDHYSRPHTRLIRSENRGVSQARNLGIDEAAGEYILPLDADDRIGPRYLEKAMAVFCARPEVGIVYCKAAFFGSRSGAWRLGQYNFPGILLGNTIFTSMVFRRDDWAAVGGYNTNMVRGWEDYDFVISLLEKGVCVHRLPETLFFYRFLPASRNQSLVSSDLVASHAQIFRNHHKFYGDNIEVLFDEIYRLREKYEQCKREAVPVKRLRQAMAARASICHARERRTNALEREVAQLRQTIASMEASVAWRVHRRMQRLTAFLSGSGTEGAPPELNMSELPPQGPVGLFRDADVTPAIRSEVDRRFQEMEDPPLVSVLLLVNDHTPPLTGREIRSLDRQLYQRWELCVVDGRGKPAADVVIDCDKERRLAVLPVAAALDEGEAFCAAADFIQGRYVAFLHPDGSLSRDALFRVVDTACRTDADFIYTDELVDADSVSGALPFWKPDFSPDLLKSWNYIGGLVVMGRELFASVVKSADSPPPSCLYDLLLRATETARMIFHLRRAVYLTGSSLPSALLPLGDNVSVLERAALESAVTRQGITARIETLGQGRRFRVFPELQGEPKVGIVVVAYAGQPLDKTLASLAGNSSACRLDCVVVADESVGDQDLGVMVSASVFDNIMHLRQQWRNRAEMVNAAVKALAVEHLVIIDAGVECGGGNWLDSLLRFSQLDNIACVGPALEEVASGKRFAAVAVDRMGGCAPVGEDRATPGDGNWFGLEHVRNVMALPDTCMMIRHEVFERLAGYDPDAPPGGQWLDFCLRAMEEGYLNLSVPWVQVRFHGRVQDKAAALGIRDREYIAARFSNLIAQGDLYHGEFRMPAGRVAVGVELSGTVSV